LSDLKKLIRPLYLISDNDRHQFASPIIRFINTNVLNIDDFRISQIDFDNDCRKHPPKEKIKKRVILKNEKESND